MKKLTDEGKMVLILLGILLWVLLATASGHSELWTYPLLLITAYSALSLVISLFREIYLAKRRERLYERRYWQKHQENP